MSVKDMIVLPPEMEKSEYGAGIKGHTMPLVHQTFAIQGPGRLALQLIEQWGLVAGEIDGEDSAGRSRIRRLTPAELVKDACATADAAWNELESRGWLLEIPLPVKKPSKEKSRVEDDA